MTAVAHRTPARASGTAATDARRALGAELVRVRRSPAALLPLVGLVVCAMSGAGMLAVSGTDAGWSALLAWHTLYVTGLSAVLGALLAGLTGRRDRGARSGGTAWRPVRPAAVRGARLLVLAGLSLVLNLLVFLPYVPLGLALGLHDAPVGALTGAAVLVWTTGLGWLVTACAVARFTGPFPVLGLALIWQAAGAVQAESPVWWTLPWTWSVRPVLPLVGVHHNGVPLEPGSPVWDYPAWPAILASLLLAVAALPVCLAGTESRRPRRRPATAARRGAAGCTTVPHGGPVTATDHGPAGRSGPGAAAEARPERDATHGRTIALPRTRVPGTSRSEQFRTPSALFGLLVSLRRTAIGPLTLGAVVLLVLVAAVRPTYLEGLFGFAVLPTGAAVLAVLSWQAQAPAWRIVLTRSAGVRWALLGVLAAVVAVTCVLAGLLMLAIGDDAAHVASRVAVGIPLGWAGVALTLWLHTRFHVAVALVVTALGGMTGVLFGGSTLAGPWLWLAGPSGWMLSATGPARTAVAIALSLTVTAAATTAWLRACVTRAGT